MCFLSSDAFFRTVFSVEILTDDKDKQRYLQALAPANGTAAANVTASNNGTNITNVDTRDSPTVFVVTGKCRECPVTASGSFNLFDDGFRRRALQCSSMKPSHMTQRQLQTGSSGCLCPPGKEPGEEPGPTAEEFVAEVSKGMVKLYSNVLLYQINY